MGTTFGQYTFHTDGSLRPFILGKYRVRYKNSVVTIPNPTKAIRNNILFGCRLFSLVLVLVLSLSSLVVSVSVVVVVVFNKNTIEKKFVYRATIHATTTQQNATHLSSNRSLRDRVGCTSKMSPLEEATAAGSEAAL